MKKAVKKQSKLSYDGRNLLTRIPKDIQKEAKLKKGQYLDWEAKEDQLKIKKTTKRRSTSK